jgi:hypothetical protein
MNIAEIVNASQNTIRVIVFPENSVPSIPKKRSPAKNALVLVQFAMTVLMPDMNQTVEIMRRNAPDR